MGDGIGEGASDAGGTDGIDFVGIKDDLGFEGLGIGLVAEAVGTDGVGDGVDVCLGPVFFC